ncbi:30S ribosomal protein S20 [Candidatus Berkelbacteria bacterium]|nr:30S ribosomal protein S20 [Candidatus Berkelbacteria bacterium]
MPISKSAKKALRGSEKKAARNRYRKALLKEALKKNDNSTISLIDKAAKWGIIHKNKAARLKSKLSAVIVTAPKTKSVTAKPKKAAPKTATSKTKKSTSKKTK